MVDWLCLIIRQRATLGLCEGHVQALRGVQRAYGWSTRTGRGLKQGVAEFGRFIPWAARTCMSYRVRSLLYVT